MNLTGIISSITLAILFSASFSVTTVNADSIMVEGFEIDYEIEGGTVTNVMVDPIFSSLVVEMDTTDDGQVQISIPRSLLDAKIGSNDDIFFVLVDDSEVIYDETNTDNSARKLLIPFSKGSTVIEIIGTVMGQAASEKKEIEPPVVEKEAEITPIAPTTTDGGGCLIATATFGSELAPQVQQLRELRDNTLLQTSSGSAFMAGFNQLYYSFSPSVADLERENPAFKEMVKLGITPMITTLSILNYVDIDSEESVLGYGIGIILLNVGMYFVAPAIVILKFRRKI